MKNGIKVMMSGALAAVMCTGAMAVELAGNTPYGSAAFGQQSDASTPAYEQTVSAPAGAWLESVTWWGYHGSNSLGGGADHFVVALDGQALTGAVAVDTSDPAVSRYTLTVAPMPLSAGVLSVVNDSFDVEWFWQSAASSGSGPHATEVAFRLEGSLGHIPTVPEPHTYALMAAGLLGLGLRARRRVG